MITKPIKKRKMKCKDHPQYREMVEIAKNVEKDFPQIQARAKIIVVSSHSFSGTAHVGIITSLNGIEFIPLYFGYYEKKASRYQVASQDNINCLRSENGCYKTGHTIEEVMEVASKLKSVALESQEKYGDEDIPHFLKLSTDD